MKHSIGVAFASLVLHMALNWPVPAIGQDLYKSKDANGKIVYSDKAPGAAASAVRLVIRPTPPSADVPVIKATSRPTHAEPTQEQLAAYKRKEQLPENRCKWLKDQLEMLAPDPRAKYAEATFEDGKTLVFGTPEFQAKVRSLETEAAEVCRVAGQQR